MYHHPAICLVLLFYSIIFVNKVNSGSRGAEECMEFTPGYFKPQRYRGSCRREKVPIFSTSCIIPVFPPNSQLWATLSEKEIVLGPQIKVPPYTTLKIICNPEYKLSGEETIYCYNTTWSSNVGDCLKLCPSIQSTKDLHVTCFYDNRRIANCFEPVEGTIIKYECSHFHEDIEVSGYGIQTCRNGSWSNEKPKCVPVCGRKTVDIQPLIINGSYVKKGEYPWQVAIYRTIGKELVCGGSLINERVILTAASCFKRDNMTKVSKELYIVAAGKYYQQYNDSRDITYGTQYSTVHDLFLPSEYQGLQKNYFADIAVLVTSESFVFSQTVQPVCVDWSLKLNEAFSKIKDLKGYITGWGYTNENNNFSERLQELEVPVINYDECIQHLNQNLSNYLTSDKLCGGYLNQSATINKGDGGGGLVVWHQDRYYIIGIASSCPQEVPGNCDKQQYAFYTNVSVYINNFIWQNIKNITVPETSEYTFTREKSIQFNESNSYFSTNRKVLCPPIISTASIEVSCISTKNKINSCLKATDGTVALFKCTPFYRNPELDKNPFSICKNGSWSHKKLTCLPVCGIKSVQAQILLINGNPVSKGSYPWQAAIYKTEYAKKGKELICGASMIHERIFLTAAHCVTNIFDNKLLPTQLFTIAVGKHYRDFDDARDYDAQFSTVEAIFVPSQYEGDLQNYFGDIAVIVTTKSFILSKNVRPVCINWDGKYEENILKPLANGIVLGWGFTQENSHPSEELRALEVPYITSTTCKARLPPDYRPYLTYDKICSGYLEKNKSACKGDSGGGLVFKNTIDGKYYIAGVVSLSPQSPTGGCNSQQYTLYTRVAYYINDFILEKVHRFGNE